MLKLQNIISPEFQQIHVISTHGENQYFQEHYAHKFSLSQRPITNLLLVRFHLNM